MTDATFDKYRLHTPSGGTFTLEVETPLTPADREWMHRIIDLIVGIGDMASLTPSEINQGEHAGLTRNEAEYACVLAANAERRKATA